MHRIFFITFIVIFNCVFFLRVPFVRAQFFNYNHQQNYDNIVFPDTQQQRPNVASHNRWDNNRPPPPYHRPSPMNSQPYGRPPHSYRPPPEAFQQFDWYGPKRPTSERYRDFAVVFHDIDRKAEANSYNITAENEALNDDFNGRSVVAPGQYPHMAALGFRTNSGELEFKCGGSLISDTFVLTAAHCCYANGVTPEVIKIGDIKLKEREQDVIPQRRRVREIYLHPYYNDSFYYNDIALIELHRPIEHTWFVRPIRLWVRDDIPYDKVYTMGYGSTAFAQPQTNILTELDMSFVPIDKCNSSLPPDESAPFGIVASQICAKDFEKNRDTCQGDSGGPLQLNLERRNRRRKRRPRYYLVGITSYGDLCRSTYPGVYTRVSSYIDWITAIVWPNYFNN